MRLAISCAAFAVVWLGFVPARADPALDALVAAYPDVIASYDQTDLIWKDGSRMPISDGRADKTFDELLDKPDIKDQFAIPYPLGADLKDKERCVSSGLDVESHELGFVQEGLRADLWRVYGDLLPGHHLSGSARLQEHRLRRHGARASARRAKRISSAVTARRTSTAAT